MTASTGPSRTDGARSSIADSCANEHERPSTAAARATSRDAGPRRRRRTRIVSRIRAGRCGAATSATPPAIRIARSSWRPRSSSTSRNGEPCARRASVSSSGPGGAPASSASAAATAVSASGSSVRRGAPAASHARGGGAQLRRRLAGAEGQQPQDRRGGQARGQEAQAGDRPRVGPLEVVEQHDRGRRGGGLAQVALGVAQELQALRGGVAPAASPGASGAPSAARSTPSGTRRSRGSAPAAATVAPRACASSRASASSRVLPRPAPPSARITPPLSRQRREAPGDRRALRVTSVQAAGPRRHRKRFRPRGKGTRANRHQWPGNGIGAPALGA